MATANLDELAASLRYEVIAMSHRAQTAHLGSALSCVDILTACYWGNLKVNPEAPLDPNRDRIILSKGHAVSALYAALAYRGYFPVELLQTYNQDGGVMPEQPSPGGAPGVEVATGSLGHG